MDKYKELLKREPLLRRLTLIQLIGYFGAWLTNVAIFTLLIQLDASPIWIGLIASAHFLFGVIQAPISGTIIDRVDTKKLMLILVGIEVITTLLLLTIESKEMLYILFTLVAIRMGSASFYFTAEMSLLPKIIDGEDLKLANELHSMIWSFTYAIGVAIGGLGVYFFSVKTAFIVDTTLFSIAFYLLLNLEFPKIARGKLETFFDSLKDGILYIKNNRNIINIILLHSLVGLLSFDSIITLVTKDFYSLDIAVPIAIGTINSIKAFSLVIGALLFSRYLNRESFFYFLIFQGFVTALWGFFIDSFYLSILNIFFVGLLSTLIWSYTYTMLQNMTDPKYYGRVIAYNDMMFLGVSALSSYLAGQLVDFGISYLTILLGIGFIFILSAFFYRSFIGGDVGNRTRVQK